MILYHGTDREFVEFYEQYFGTNPERASNGHLGVWCAESEELAARFGSRVLVIDVNPANAIEVKIGEVALWHRTLELYEDPSTFYKELRAKFLASGYDLIRVIEISGKSDMSIILNLDAIHIIAEVFF